MPVMMTLGANSAKLLDYCSHRVLLTSTVFDALLISFKVVRKWVLEKATGNCRHCAVRAVMVAEHAPPSEALSPALHAANTLVAAFRHFKVVELESLVPATAGLSLVAATAGLTCPRLLGCDTPCYRWASVATAAWVRHSLLLLG